MTGRRQSRKWCIKRRRDSCCNGNLVTEAEAMRIYTEKSVRTITSALWKRRMRLSCHTQKLATKVAERKEDKIMDMSFWNYVLYRRRKAERERKAKETFTIVAVVSVVCLVATYVATM